MPKQGRIFEQVIGVDPGWGCTGVVILKWSHVLEDWRITFARGYKSNSEEDDRAGRLIAEIAGDLEARVCPSIQVVFAIEENHFTGGRSAQTALKQRELIGILDYVAHRMAFRTVRIAATSAKKALVGSGKAEKEDMVEWAKAVPGFPCGLPKYQEEAVADAVGVAMAGAAKAEKELS